MSTARERFFECTAVCRGRVRLGIVRAWDPAGAQAAFRAALASEGLRPRGRIAVRDASGHLAESGSAPVAP